MENRIGVLRRKSGNRTEGEKKRVLRIFRQQVRSRKMEEHYGGREKKGKNQRQGGTKKA